MKHFSFIKNLYRMLQIFMRYGTNAVHCTLNDTQMFYPRSAGFYLPTAPGNRFLDSNRFRLFVSSGLRPKFYPAT
jgi:hypothetical protein